MDVTQRSRPSGHLLLRHVVDRSSETSLRSGAQRVRRVDGSGPRAHRFARCTRADRRTPPTAPRGRRPRPPVRRRRRGGWARRADTRPSPGEVAGGAARRALAPRRRRWHPSGEAVQTQASVGPSLPTSPERPSGPTTQLRVPHNRVERGGPRGRGGRGVEAGSTVRGRRVGNGPRLGSGAAAGGRVGRLPRAAAYRGASLTTAETGPSCPSGRSTLGASWNGAARWRPRPRDAARR